MKNEFIKSIKNVDITQEEPYLGFEDAIRNLPNCYAKGYLTAKFYAHNAEDMEEMKEDILRLAGYDIWRK